MSNEMQIYLLVNKVNGKKYVGQTTVGSSQRWNQHVYVAKTESGKKFALHHAIAKYGPGAFDRTVLQICDTEDELNAAEVRWIAALNSMVPNGYNLAHGGSSGSHSEETKAFLSGLKKGISFSDEHRKNISLSQIGKKKARTPEHEMALAVTRIGRPHSEATKLKMSLAKRGRVFSEEHRAKLSAAHQGVPRPRTAEHQEKINETKREKRLQEELGKVESVKSDLQITKEELCS